jgi:hypothetical protein
MIQWLRMFARISKKVEVHKQAIFRKILETWVQRCRTWLDKLASVCCGYWACVFPVFISVFCNMLWQYNFQFIYENVYLVGLVFFVGSLGLQ